MGRKGKNSRSEVARLRRENRRMKSEKADSYIHIGSRLADVERPLTERERRMERDALVTIPPEKPVVPVRLLVLLGIVVAVIAFGVWRFRIPVPGERVHSYHKTMREAVNAGAVREGWIPRYIPLEATEIHEMHDSGTGAGWISFRFPREITPRLVEKFSPVSEGKLKGTVIPGVGEPWWPGELDGKWNGMVSSKYSVCWTGRASQRSGQRELIAFDWAGGKAFVWR